MKRREFLGIAVAGAAGVVLPARGTPSPSVEATLAQPRLIAILHDAQLVRDLGRRYREVVPLENDANVLTAALITEVNASDTTLPLLADGATIQRGVDELVLRDFNAGRTVTLNGWILSLTEARQCALFSLLGT